MHEIIFQIGFSRLITLNKTKLNKLESKLACWTPYCRCVFRRIEVLHIQRQSVDSQ